MSKEKEDAVTVKVKKNKNKEKFKVFTKKKNHKDTEANFIEKLQAKYESVSNNIKFLYISICCIILDRFICCNKIWRLPLISKNT